MKKQKTRKTTSDAIKILSSIAKKDKKSSSLFSEALINARVAQLIYKARSSANLTQKQLADLVGTNQPVIARLEDADYLGHSLTMLQKIALALNSRIEINLVPRKKLA